MEINKKIIFFGTPEFAAAQLRNLIQSGFDVAAVVTAPDKPAGRGNKLQQSAVKTTAIQYNLPVLQPQKLKEESFIHELSGYNASVFVVIAFRMLPEIVWRMPQMGTINLHASLLPQYRGAAPINRAIMQGETITGLTTFFIDDKIDEGKIIEQVQIEIGADENAGELHDRMVEIGKPLVIKTINSILNRTVNPKQQSELIGDEQISKEAPKIFKNDCLIDWKQTINTIHNQIRGLSPYPTAYSSFISSENQLLDLKIYQSTIELAIPNEEIFSILTDNKRYLKIALPEGYLHILKVQQPGKKIITMAEFLCGYHFSGIWRAVSG